MLCCAAVGLDDLTDDERLALGGLLRMLVRADGDFSEAEEASINLVGERIGGSAGALWRLISRSAQDCPEDDGIRAAARRVERHEARLLLRSVLEEVAATDLVAEPEHQLLSWLDEIWR